MKVSTLNTALLSASLASATTVKKGQGFHSLALKARLQYFGTAVDNPELSPNVTLNPYSIANEQYRAIANDAEEFGQITPANGLKWMFTERERGVFNYTLSDEILKPAKANGQIQRCHALLWHNQLPTWLTSQNWTSTEMLEIMETHIKNEAGYYAGECAHWDVVNEALLDDGTFRPTPFYNALGPSYIARAFEFAAKYDPNAKLYYNDYGIERVNNKSRAAAALVQDLQSQGIKIDGVGLQSHFTVGRSPSYDDQIANMAQFAALNVDVAITELDVRMALPDDRNKTLLQAQIYTNTTQACVDTERCVGITLWDFYDPFSWIPNAGGEFAGQGNPLVFREGDFAEKPAYYAVKEVLAR